MNITTLQENGKFKQKEKTKKPMTEHDRTLENDKNNLLITVEKKRERRRYQ